jgi:DNA-binding NarL/FixJ family response regulator/transcriptional regulator with XRE-family HTH domain
LRTLRRATGLTYRQMAELAHFSVPTLSSAAAGRELPTLPVLDAYLSACGVRGAELDAWRRRWTSLTNRTPADRPTDNPRQPNQTVEATAPGDRRSVDPEQIRTPEELAVALNTLRGDLSYQQLAAAARGLPQAGPRRRGLPVSTISDLLNSGRTSPGTLTTYLAACRVPEGAWDPWLSAWARTRPSRPGRPRAVAAEPLADGENSAAVEGSPAVENGAAGENAGSGAGVEGSADVENSKEPAGERDVISVAAVDDHPIVLSGLAAELGTRLGLSVIATASSVDELLAGPGRQAAVVLLDLDFGDFGDGTNPEHNIHRVVAAGPAVVVFTEATAPQNVRNAMMAGAAAFVAKTAGADELLTAIRAAAAGGGWVSPELAFMLLTDDEPDRPSLSKKEREALRLYAAGMPMKVVARRMGVGLETAKQYIERVRRKYQRAGREASTKVDLYRRATEDGHLP